MNGEVLKGQEDAVILWHSSSLKEISSSIGPNGLDVCTANEMK